MKSHFKIAVLLTCHNRRDKTLSCLHSLRQASLTFDHRMDVYLVDDGSTDGTGEAVKNNFPEVHVIQGNGNLFWNQGMRLAWGTASQTAKHDFYLWLNDDTLLSPFALTELFESYQEAVSRDGQPAIVVGACESFAGSNEFSYGGRNDSGSIEPNGDLQGCKYINGNVVLVSRSIFETLGNLSNDYTHAMGDIDYGLRATTAGFNCYSTKGYIATCPRHSSIPGWKDPKVPLSKRLKLTHSPQGLNLREYIRFRQKFWGYLWIKYALLVYMKVLFPRIYSKITKL